MYLIRNDSVLWNVGTGAMAHAASVKWCFA